MQLNTEPHRYRREENGHTCRAARLRGVYAQSVRTHATHVCCCVAQWARMCGGGGGGAHPGRKQREHVRHARKHIQ